MVKKGKKWMVNVKNVPVFNFLHILTKSCSQDSGGQNSRESNAYGWKYLDYVCQ